MSKIVLILSLTLSQIVSAEPAKYMYDCYSKDRLVEVQINKKAHWSQPDEKVTGRVIFNGWLPEEARLLCDIYEFDGMPGDTDHGECTGEKGGSKIKVNVLDDGFGMKARLELVIEGTQSNSRRSITKLKCL